MIWGNGFRDLGPSNGGACAPVQGVQPCWGRCGRDRPLSLRRSGVSPPENFLRFLMPNPAFGGNLGQKIN